MKELEKEPSTFKSSSLCLLFLKSNDDDFRKYTGFQNYTTFKALFEFLEPLATSMYYWGVNSRPASDSKFSTPQQIRCSRKLSLEEEFLAVLVRLKCRFRNSDVARFYDLSPSRFSVIFNT